MVERKQHIIAATKAAFPESATQRLVTIPGEVRAAADEIIRADPRSAARRPSRSGSVSQDGLRPTLPDVYLHFALEGLRRDKEAREKRIFEPRNAPGVRQSKQQVLFPAAEYEEIRAIATAEGVDILDVIVWLMRLGVATPAPPL